MAKKIEKETRYCGYFLMDSGLKVKFDISAEDGGENYDNLYGNPTFDWEQDESIYYQTQQGKDTFLLANKVIGFSIEQYDKEI